MFRCAVVVEARDVVIVVDAKGLGFGRPRGVVDIADHGRSSGWRFCKTVTLTAGAIKHLAVFVGRRSPRRPLTPRFQRRVEFRFALGMDRELGALRAVGGEERSQIGKPGVAVLGHQSGDAVDAPALAAGAHKRHRGDDKVKERYRALPGHACSIPHGLNTSWRRLTDAQSNPRFRLALYPTFRIFSVLKTANSIFGAVGPNNQHVVFHTVTSAAYHKRWFAEPEHSNEPLKPQRPCQMRLCLAHGAAAVRCLVDKDSSIEPVLSPLMETRQRSHDVAGVGQRYQRSSIFQFVQREKLAGPEHAPHISDSITVS
jgi:hypothetical protein